MAQRRCPSTPCFASDPPPHGVATGRIIFLPNQPLPAIALPMLAHIFPDRFVPILLATILFASLLPVRGAAVMNENPSWVFFRELTGPGPLGAMGLPVTGRASVAADPKYVPLGAPVILSLDRAEPNGLWIAQDTGGAIKGANRFDTFWGAGAEARRIAGGLSARGEALLLLPRASVDRLRDARAFAQP